MGLALHGKTNIWLVFVVGLCFYTFNIYIHIYNALKIKVFCPVTEGKYKKYTEVQRNQSYSYLGHHIPRSLFPSLPVDPLIPLKNTLWVNV